MEDQENSSVEISVVVPVYNTSIVLNELYERLAKVFGSIGRNWELILVDDRSPNDDSWNTITRLASAHTEVHGVQLSRNFGQQSATLCGMSLAKGNWIITMDDDLQHRPEDIPSLLSKSDHDIVLAEFDHKKHGVWKKMLSRMKGYFDHILIGKPKHIQLTPFRCLQRHVVDGMLKIKSGHPFIPAMMLYVSKDVVTAPAQHDERAEGNSGYTLGKMLKLFSNLMINNSSFLLKQIGRIGIGIALLSFAVGIYFIIKKFFFGISVLGWASMITTLLFIGGLILFSIGVIGEYLIRIISGVEEKPTFIVREHTE